MYKMKIDIIKMDKKINIQTYKKNIKKKSQNIIQSSTV